MDKKASIKLEEIKSKTLDEVSAADFLTALGSNNMRILEVFPEKKKVEIEIDPPLHRINLETLIDKLRGEKKKKELEFDRPFDLLRDPEIYQSLVKDIAKEVSILMR